MKTLLVLAGGFGTRLRGLVSDVPKPLAPVSGKPFIVHLIERWVEQGVKEFVFLLHFESYLIEHVLRDISKTEYFRDIKINVIVEEKPLGTGGSVWHAIKTLGITESFLVVNADTWLSKGISEINNSLPNTIGAVEANDCSRYGALVVNDGIVQEFLEKSESVGEGLINAGMYHLSPSIFEDCPENSSFSLESKIFPNVIKNGILGVVEMDADFIDIGVPEDYLKFCRWMELGEKFER